MTDAPPIGLVPWETRHRAVRMYSVNVSHRPDRPPFQSVRLPDQPRERIRYLHYSTRTGKGYVYRARLLLRRHGLQHPPGMRSSGVEAFLIHLAN